MGLDKKQLVLRHPPQQSMLLAIHRELAGTIFYIGLPDHMVCLGNSGQPHRRCRAQSMDGENTFRCTFLHIQTGC